MAVLSNPVYYEAGISGASNLVGVSDKKNRNVRYTLTVDKAESASRLAFVMKGSSTGSIAWGSGGDNYVYINGALSLYFAISTDPDEFANAGIAEVPKALGKVTLTETGGYWVEGNVTFNATGEADFYLLPGQTYYLWIFPGYTNADGGNGVWGWFYWNSALSTTVDLSGVAGVVRIDTGLASVIAIPCIDTGAEWKQAIPFVDTGSGFNICG